MNQIGFAFKERLIGRQVELCRLKKEHFSALIQIATQHKVIWTHLEDLSTNEKISHALEMALKEKTNGSQFPYVVIDKRNQQIIGSTRYLDVSPAHRKLEIGWTWYHPDYWGSGINFECKHLLLKQAFEDLKCIRVQLKTNPDNVRSRKAIEKIGAQFEGILRKERIRPDGFIRSPAYYSIIDDEWPLLRKKLEQIVQEN